MTTTDSEQPNESGDAARLSSSGGGEPVAAPSAAPSAEPDAQPPTQALFVPRGLVMIAAIWVFLSWVLLFGIRPPIQPQTASYGPTLELLFISIGVGVAIGWPLLRLSARPSRAPIGQALFDGLALILLMQVVIWPLRLVSNWTIPRMWLILASLGAAIALTGALLAATQGSTNRATRTRAMTLAVVIALAPLGVRLVGEFVSPSGSPIFDVSPSGTSSGAGSTVPTGAADRETPPPAWTGLVEQLAPLSGPVLLGRASAPMPLDPSDREWAVLRRAGLVILICWVVAVLLAARSRRAAIRPEGPVPLS
jgi:hypothetical protein